MTPPELTLPVVWPPHLTRPPRPSHNLGGIAHAQPQFQYGSEALLDDLSPFSAAQTWSDSRSTGTEARRPSGQHESLGFPLANGPCAPAAAAPPPLALAATPSATSADDSGRLLLLDAMLDEPSSPHSPQAEQHRRIKNSRSPSHASAGHTPANRTSPDHGAAIQAAGALQAAVSRRLSTNAAAEEPSSPQAQQYRRIKWNASRAPAGAQAADPTGVGAYGGAQYAADGSERQGDAGRASARGHSRPDPDEPSSPQASELVRIKKQGGGQPHGPHSSGPHSGGPHSGQRASAAAISDAAGVEPHSPVKRRGGQASAPVA